MTRHATDLPTPHASSTLNINAFARAFDKRTTSYKHLYFLALLEEVKENNFRAATISVHRMAARMLFIAIHPVMTCRLQLGAQDQVSNILASVLGGQDRQTLSNRTQLQALETSDIARQSDLLRYVPYRLLSPFFPDAKDEQDTNRNRLIEEQSRLHFSDLKPLYRINVDKSIELHPDWLEYLQLNFPIVMAWAERHWIDYLQSRNPTVPAIPAKIRAPEKRRSLATQRAFWNIAIEGSPTPVRCIYSSRPLVVTDYELDHFLPWTFTGHDEIWNMVPASPSANSAKSDSLPHVDYIDPAVELIHTGLMTAKAVMREHRAWRTIEESFGAGLRISASGMLDLSTLRKSYHDTWRPQMTIAHSIGFQEGWQSKIELR
jgi:hypothetical protein